MQKQTKNYALAAGFVLICLAVGFIGSFSTATSITSWYAGLEKPFFNPPNWLFGPVWTLLYTLMGLAGYYSWTQRKKRIGMLAFKVFLLQLFFNFWWTPIFFGLQNMAFALVVIIIMWGLIVYWIRLLFALNKKVAWSQIPYVLWVTFATLLNASLFYLN
jgi:tryptophan-rich sensory protein